jgi:tRNA threonylcarbamoyladenosine biosynthesis protein TsaE
MKLHLGDPEATAELAQRLNSVLPADTAGWTLLLDGELGAGKSTFARALIRAMGHHGAVPSPTYTLVEPYELPGRLVYHVDLYRIADEEELRYLGWTELEDGLRIVEWPDRAPDLLAAADLKLVLAYAGAGRDAEFSALSPRGEALIADLEAAALTDRQD